MSYVFKTDSLCMMIDIAGEKQTLEDIFRVDEDLEAWKILGANIHRWDNFQWFFQKKDLPISIFSKNYSPKF